MDEDQKKMMEELLFSGEKKLSFAKMLFFGGFHASSVFPFPVPGKEEQAFTDDFVEKVKAFTEKEIDGDKIDRECNIPNKVVKGMADLGLLGLTVSEEYGGLGRTQYCFSRSIEEIAKACGSTALFVNVHLSIGLRALALFGTDEQKKKWLPKLASGKKLAAFSLTEPNAGSDASAVETKAVFDKEKNVYRISGKKQWTTNGGIADILTVMAKTDIGGEEKITAFLVTKNMKGFKVIEKALDKVGMRGTKTANLEFDNVEVPAENILGPLGGGLRVCLTVLDYGRTTFGATCSGAAKYLVERAMAHATDRHQFKRPLASFPIVKKKLAMMNAYCYAMDAATFLTAGLIDRGEEEFMLEAAILKVFNSDGLWDILYDTMQIFGGRSFFTDQPFERMMRDARLNMIGEGSNEVLRAFIALVGMRDVGMHLEGVLNTIKSPFGKKAQWKGMGSQLSGFFTLPQIPVQAEAMQKEAKALAQCLRRFKTVIVRLLGKYKEEIVEQQLILDRITNITMALYTISAVLGKFDRDVAMQNGNRALVKNYEMSAKLYCSHAFRTIGRNFKALFKNDDTQIESVADRLTGLKPQ